MKNYKITCDRCKRETAESRGIILTGWRGYHEDTLDLCPLCFEDLRLFLKRKPLLNGLRDIFR